MESIGRYQVVRELGQGATATVYLCDDPQEDRQVAIKLVRFDKKKAFMSKRLRKLFMVEQAMGGRLVHDNIVRIYDAHVGDDMAYLIMELIDGGSLEDHCSIDSLLPLDKAVGIVFKCAIALDYAYKQGIVHRDIKPANIMLDKNLEPKIADFGLSVYLDKDINKDSTFIMGAGSPAYMSPEQIKGYQLNQKTDIYSLGIVLFQLLTGRLPFRATNPATLMYKIVNMDPPKARDLNPNLPEAIDIYLRKALEKDLYSRYTCGADFGKDLSAVRYEIFSDTIENLDTEHYKILRTLKFFTDFDKIELWELLRIGVWKQYEPGVILVHEGGTDSNFGIVIEGEVEVSMKERVICRLGPSEPVGEMNYLTPGKRSATVTVIEPTLFLHIKASALALSSDELHERMQQTLVATLTSRLRQTNIALAARGKPAIKGDKEADPVAVELTLLDA